VPVVYSPREPPHPPVYPTTTPGPFALPPQSVMPAAGRPLTHCGCDVVFTEVQRWGELTLPHIPCRRSTPRQVQDQRWCKR
jgi:hypothetical protein